MAERRQRPASARAAREAAPFRTGIERGRGGPDPLQQGVDAWAAAARQQRGNAGLTPQARGRFAAAAGSSNARVQSDPTVDVWGRYRPGDATEGKGGGMYPQISFPRHDGTYGRVYNRQYHKMLAC